MKKILFVTGIWLLMSGYCSAWMSENDVGTCGAQFLKIGIGAKPMGMGGAASAASDASGLYWNPAGIASLEKKEVLFQHTQWFMDTSIEFLGAAIPVGSKVLGFSFTYLKIDDFEERTEDTSKPISSFNASDSAVGITYAKKMGSVNWGGTVKAIQSKIKNYTSNTVIAADVGFQKKGMFIAGKPAALALILKDYGTKIKLNTKPDNLPSVIKLGMAMEVSPQIKVAADINLPRDNEVNLNIGLEYKLPVKAVDFPVRVGYKTLNDFDTIDGFSAGFGIGTGAYSFDFAWVPYGDFDDTYRISLSGKF